MADLRRVIRYFLAVVACLWWSWFCLPQPAHAYPATEIAAPSCTDPGPGPSAYPPASAYTDTNVGWSGNPVWGHPANNCTFGWDYGQNCNYTWACGSDWWGLQYAGVSSTQTIYQCPAGGTLDGKACDCSSSETDTGTACVDNSTYNNQQLQKKCQGLAGQAPSALTCNGTSCGAYGTQSWAQGSHTMCVDNCLVSGGLDLAWQEGTLPNGQPQWGAYTSGNSYTGSVCNDGYGSDPNMPTPTATTSTPGGTGTATFTPTDPITSDTAGKCPGQVNGVTVWMPCSTSSSPVWNYTTTFTVSNPDGSTQTTNTGNQSQTNCLNGVCVTSTTATQVVTGSGTSTTVVNTGSTSQTLADYCKSNPKDPQCAGAGGGGSGTDTWGGSCSSGFQCSGDAVSCAISQAVWQTKCSMIDGPSTPTAEQQAYSAAKGASGAGLGTSTVAISSANFDSSNALGVGAQCIADFSVTVWGTAQTIAVSKVCPWLQTLGTIMLALAWLSAAVIVGKGVNA